MGFVKLGGDLTTGSGAVNIAASPYMLEDVVRPLPPMDVDYETPESDGMVYIGAARRCPVITMRIWVMGTSEQRRTRARTLARLLLQTAPMRLEFEDDGGRYYHVVCTGDTEPVDFIDSTFFDVSFQSVYPYMFGESRTYTLSNTAQSISTLGTYPALLVLTSSSLTTSSSGTFGVVVGTKTLTYNVGDASSTYGGIRINWDTRATSISSRNLAPSIGSEWASIASANGSEYRTTARVTVAGNSPTLTVTDRWL